MSMATNGSGTPSPAIVEEHEESRENIKENRRQMAAVRRELEEIFKRYEKEAKAQLGNLTRKAHQAYEGRETDQSKGTTADIQKLMEDKVKEMKQLKEDVERCLKDALKETSESEDTTSKDDKTNESQAWKEMDKELENMLENAAKGDKGEDFDRMPETFRNCLLCLSIFPLGSEISKRVLIYWWIGEGFIAPSQDKTAEEVGEDYFKQLLDHEFIHPVYNKRSGNIVKCMIHPWIHWMLISKARKRQLFQFDETGTPISSPSNLHHDCLITKLNDGQQEQKSYKPDEKLVLLFNVNVKYLDLDLESFSKMKNIVVLQLGRWQTSAQHHIEMDPRVLEKLSSLSNLKYLSLRGISVIETIPKSISKLQYLQVLDLRGCQNLKNLTDGVTKLKRLTHLDVSECYMLESMPKGLGSLSELLVIKGFVISRSHRKTGKIADLLNLHKLKKLSIIIGSQVKKSRDLGELVKMEGLSSLTVIWSDLPDTTPGYEMHDVDSLKFPPNLEKLDLRFYPIIDMPKQLDPKYPTQLKKLKKLYIRGGKLETLVLKPSEEGIHPKLELLRLKFLQKLKLKWSDIELPSLDYLEHFACKKMEADPPLMDEDGVWTRVKETDSDVPPDLDDDNEHDEPAHDPSSSASTETHLIDPHTTSPDGISASGVDSIVDEPTSGTPHVPSHIVPAPTTASGPSSSTPTTVPPNKVDHEDDLEDKSEHDITSSASTAAHAIDPNTASSDDVTVSAFGAASMAAETTSGTPSVPSHSLPGPTNAADVTRDSSLSSNPSSSTTTPNQPSTSTPQVNSSLESPPPAVFFHSPETDSEVPPSITTVATDATSTTTTTDATTSQTHHDTTTTAPIAISTPTTIPSTSTSDSTISAPLAIIPDVAAAATATSPSPSGPSSSPALVTITTTATSPLAAPNTRPALAPPTCPTTTTDVSPPTPKVVPSTPDLDDDNEHDEPAHDPSSSASTETHLIDPHTTSPDGISTSGVDSIVDEPTSGTPHVPAPTTASGPSSSIPTTVPPNKVDHEDDLEDKSEHDIASSASTAAHAIDPNTASSDDVTISAFGAASMAAEPTSGTPSVPSHSFPGPTNAADVTRDSSLSSNPSSFTTTPKQPSTSTPPRTSSSS